jgi:DNA primase small subunit
MPHSLSPEAKPSEPDANMDIAETEESQGVSNEQSQDVEDLDNDMKMEEAGVQGEPVLEAEVKQEVKLEDLFADVDSDEEFLSSAGLDVKASSSPEAPASPM